MSPYAAFCQERRRLQSVAAHTGRLADVTEGYLFLLLQLLRRQIDVDKNILRSEVMRVVGNRA